MREISLVADAGLWYGKMIETATGMVKDL